MRSQIARKMANCRRLRSMKFICDIRFIPLATLVKVLVEIAFTFTTVIVAISLTSMEHLLAVGDMVYAVNFLIISVQRNMIRRLITEKS